jgi:hypothetical protein
MKSVIVHALLAALGLGFAYQTWTRPAVLVEKPSDEVVLLACEPEQLEAIELVSPTHRVNVKPVQGKEGREYWITSTPTTPEKKVEPKPASDGLASSADAGVSSGQPSGQPSAPKAEPAAPALPSGQTKPMARKYDAKVPATFVANAAFDLYLNAYLPVRALRGLGVIDKKDYAGFGLDKVGTYLRIACGGKKLALDIAGRTHGTNDNYARDPKTDQSYLVPGRLVRDLQSSQFNFTQSELHAFKLSEVDETVLTAMGEEKRLLHRDRLIPGHAQWVDAEHPDRKNELFGNWLDRLAKLKVRAYLGRDDKPGADLIVSHSAPVTVLNVEHRVGGKPKGKLEVVRVDADGVAFYYARSEATRIWVSLYEAVVKELMQDLGLVIGAEEANESSAPADAKSPAAPSAAP